MIFRICIDLSTIIVDIEWDRAGKICACRCHDGVLAVSRTVGNSRIPPGSHIIWVVAEEGHISLSALFECPRRYSGLPTPFNHTCAEALATA